MHNQRYVAAFTVALLAMLAHQAAAHPSHVSIAEAEYNPQSKHLEVALRVHPSDLERALRIRTKKRVDLDKTKNIDALITAYLQDVFQIKASDGKEAQIKWVGKEISLKWGWLYFEVPVKEGLDKVKFSNQIFFELIPDQTNTILLKEGKRKSTLQFTRQQLWKSLPPSSPPPSAD